MTSLSVNVNKAATLRNARGGNNPDVLKFALDSIAFGADGITVHPRPDERHIRRSDVYAIAEAIDVEFNVEGYPSEDFLRLIEDVRPAQCTLVPDAPDVLTSNQGWDTVKHEAFLKETVSRLHEAGVRTSVFIDPDEKLLDYAKATGTDRVELYTEPYAAHFEKDKEKAIAPFVRAAQHALKIDLGLNAGHDLNLDNLHYLYINIPNLREVSIGHALICDSLYLGLQETIRRYKASLER